jgi:hypothetical protein
VSFGEGRGEYEITFPYGHRLKQTGDDFIRSELFKLIQSINLTKRKYPNILPNVDSERNCSIFDSMFFLLEDYFENGLFDEHIKENSTFPRGRILWKKTMQSNKLVTKKGIFFQGVYYQAINSQENLVTRLEISCLHIAKEELFFLFDDFSLPPETIDHPGDYIPYLSNRLSKTYIDREKSILLAMISILRNRGGALDASSRDIGTSSYYAVWECMLREIYGNDDESKYFPQGMYQIGNDEPKKASELRPDIIHKGSDGCYYILDAKYYPYGETKSLSDLPSSESIAKQVIYGKYVHDYYGSDEIYNAFVIPSDEKGVTYKGRAYLKDDREMASSFHVIHVLTKNTNEVLDYFCNHQPNPPDDVFTSLRTRLKDG